MKQLPMRFRERESDWFGKRGMSWHGAAIFVGADTENAYFGDALERSGDPDSREYPYQVYFIDDVLLRDQKQDTLSVVCLLEAVLFRIRKWFPQIRTISFQSDNASAYSGALLSFVMPTMCSNYGLRVTGFVHNEAGDGKTVLDNHFGVMGGVVTVRLIAIVYVLLCIACCTDC